ncbi:MAG: phosphotransferase family protein [Myxococcales bacterium]|nr:phosphotransferase family protein [Myxococcales bacterium]
MPQSLDLHRLQDWLGSHLPAPLDRAFTSQQLDIKAFSGGASNLTYSVKADDVEVVLRRAPPGQKAKTAHDMVREARVLSAVARSFPLVPKVYAVCDDPEVIGTRFFVMERLRGHIAGRSMPTQVTPRQCTQLMTRLMDVHAELHSIDLIQTGLIELGKPTGYVERQIAGWSKRYRAARTDDVPDCEEVMSWLAAHQPAQSGTVLIHNDFKLDNVVLATDDPTQIVGVLDWEMATIGDPLMDLGASMAYWIEPTDPTDLHVIRTLPSTLPGMPSRAQLIARYAAQSGREIGDFSWYYVYGLFRLAAIAQQIYLRYTLGQTTNPRFAMLGHGVRALSDQASRVIRQQQPIQTGPMGGSDSP